MEKKIIKNDDFYNWVAEIKEQVKSAQLNAASSINSTLMKLYWNLGEKIVIKQSSSKWGSSIINELSKELHYEFPKIKGFSKRNIYAIRQWYLFYSQDFTNVPQAVAQIPWGHNRLIISKIKNINECLFYANETIKTNWYQ
ncbi:MAG: DUF1016 N-terminal domain-containing protein [Candidatus Cloacimonadota bacterium]|nr:DUF1016 N-terminal domain-containing protein [Candidatus Cloacimonadota bacterium]